MKKLMAIAAVMAVGLGVLVAGPSTASAQKSDVVFHGRDKAIVVDAKNDLKSHQTIAVCDEEKDGHYVEAWFKYVTGDGSGPKYESAEDLDGSKGGCTRATFESGAIVEFALCEENKGCTEYYPTHIGA